MANRSAEESAKNYEECRKVAEQTYFQWIAGQPARDTIKVIAELLHYGNADLDLIRQRMALQQS